MKCIQITQKEEEGPEFIENLHNGLAKFCGSVHSYVFNLASIRPGAARVQRPQTTVPPNMQFDADGRLETEETVN